MLMPPVLTLPVYVYEAELGNQCISFKMDQKKPFKLKFSLDETLNRIGLFVTVSVV